MRASRVLFDSAVRHMEGGIQLIFGPMFSGKSTELMRRMRRYELAQKRCLLIKYAKDNRYESNLDQLVTHDRHVYEAIAVTRLDDARAVAAGADVIGVDEGQFYPDTVPFCEDLANQGKTVVVAALDGTFQRKPFGSLLDLVPLAEHVDKLSAVCMACFRSAAFSRRVVDDDSVELIGGADKYLAVCRACYHLPIEAIRARQRANEKADKPQR